MRVAGLETCQSVVEGDARRFQQCLDALAQLVENTVLAFKCSVHIERGAVSLYAVSGSGACLLHDVGGMAQAFGGDAPLVETRAAQVVGFVHNMYVQAGFGCPYGTFVAPGAGTDDEKSFHGNDRM